MSDRSCHHAVLCSQDARIILESQNCIRSSRLQLFYVGKQNTQNTHDACTGKHSLGKKKNHWKFKKRRVIMIYVARQNLISPVHVDLNCGKTASRAPPPTGFFPPCHQSSGSSDSTEPHRAASEHNKRKTLTLLDISNTTNDWSAQQIRNQITIRWCNNNG